MRIGIRKHENREDYTILVQLSRHRTGYIKVSPKDGISFPELGELDAADAQAISDALKIARDVLVGSILIFALPMQTQEEATE